MRSVLCVQSGDGEEPGFNANRAKLLAGMPIHTIPYMLMIHTQAHASGSSKPDVWGTLGLHPGFPWLL